MQGTLIFNRQQFIERFLEEVEEKLGWSEEKIASFKNKIANAYTPVEIVSEIEENPQVYMILSRLYEDYGIASIFKDQITFEDEEGKTKLIEKKDTTGKVYFEDEEGNIYVYDPNKYLYLLPKLSKTGKKLIWILPISSNWQETKEKVVIHKGEIKVRSEEVEFWTKTIVQAVRNEWGDVYLNPTVEGYELQVRNKVGKIETIEKLSKNKAEKEIRKLITWSPVGQKYLNLHTTIDTSINFSMLHSKETGEVLKAFLLSLQDNGAEADLRISLAPVVKGKTLDVRVLPKKRSIANSLVKLGYTEEHEQRLIALTKYANGMIVVSGPTGSGKSTLLYWLMKRLRRLGKRILSVEDPVEITIDGIQQVEVKLPVYDEEGNRIGVDFALAIKTFLRQNPDVIIVGETRDRETAEKVLEASNTGHLVATTIHANDEFSTIRRFLKLLANEEEGNTEAIVDMLLSQLKAVVSQRLIPRVCRNCIKEGKIEKTTLTEEILNSYPVEIREQLKDLVGKEIFIRVNPHNTCGKCMGGYDKRIPIVGILEMSNSLRDFLIDKNMVVLTKEFNKVAKEEAEFHSLIEDGKKRLENGDITLEDFARLV